MTPLDLSLYLVADQEFCRQPGIEAVVARAIDGGVSMVQLRGSRADLRQLLADALALRKIAAARGIPFVVNDHVDIALAADADGVHVGQADMPVTVARRLLGKDKIIGLSVTREVELADPSLGLADYIGLGPVFPTRTKSDAAPALGLDRFQAIRTRIALPVVAIGGITRENAGDVMAAGADGIAVVSAICSAADPRDAAAALKRVVMEAKR